MNATQFKKGDWLYDTEEHDYFLYCNEDNNGMINILHAGLTIFDNYFYCADNRPGRFVIVDKERVPKDFLKGARSYETSFA